MNTTNVSKVTVIILLTIIATGSSCNFAFALGPPGPPTVDTGADPFTQKVNAGDTAVYTLWISPDWFNDWFNVSIGSRFNGTEQNSFVEPLPKGVEVNYSRRVFVGANGISYFPVSVKVPPDTGRSTIDLAILTSGRSKIPGQYYNQTFSGGTIIRLYVEPKNTSLGAAYTVFYEGFDREFTLFKERDTSTPNGWSISKTGTIDITNHTGMILFRTAALQMDKTASSSAEPVWIEHIFPKINSSFILDFALQTGMTGTGQSTTNNSFTMYLIDSLQNTNITTAGLSNGHIAVQSRDYGAYSTNHWYRFKLEADAVNHTFRWYLDDKYMDTLPFTGQPDKIRIAITGNQPSTSYVDDIFLQKIIGYSANTSANSSTSVAGTNTVTTKILTTTVTDHSLLTFTTTLSTTVTSTTTTISTERVADSSTIAWAIGATIVAAVLALVAVRRRR